MIKKKDVRVHTIGDKDDVKSTCLSFFQLCRGILPKEISSLPNENVSVPFKDERGAYLKEKNSVRSPEKKRTSLKEKRGFLPAEKKLSPNC